MLIKIAKMKMKTLTISIAAYNIEKFIDNTLENICKDDVIEDLEIIIVNDGSKDNTLLVSKKYEARYPESIVIIDKENGGYGSTINASLPIAKGKYYKLLDGDDWYDYENLKNLVSFLKKNETDLVITPHVQVIDETREETVIKPFNSTLIGKEFGYKEYPIGQRICMHQACFKTSAIQNKKIRISEHCFYTDVEYLLKCMSKCDTIVYVDYPVYMYRIGLEEQSMSVEGMRKHYRDAVISYKELIRFRNEDINNKDYCGYLDDAMISLGRYYLNMFFILDKSKKHEYIEFDQYIKENASDIYDRTESRTLKLLRKTNNHLYALICLHARRKTKKAIRL